jgi:hypothetical protein
MSAGMNRLLRFGALRRKLLLDQLYRMIVDGTGMTLDFYAFRGKSLQNIMIALVQFFS